jgi:non-ribosomal peptide synthetase component F
VRDVTLGAYAHEELPFEHVVQALRPEWARRFNPLFNVAFSHNFSEPAPDANPARQTEFPPPQREGQGGGGPVDQDSIVVPGPSRYELLVVTADAAEGFRVTFDYSRDLFDDATMTRLLDDLMVVLEGAVDHPDRAVETWPLRMAVRAGA